MTILEIVLISVIAVAVAVVVGIYLFKLDTKIEQFKRVLMVISGNLRTAGLELTPDFLDCFVVDDVSGAIQKGIELVKLFKQGNVAVLAEFDRVFENVLTKKLLTETGRAYIAAKLEDAVQPTDVASVQNAPQATTV